MDLTLILASVSGLVIIVLFFFIFKQSSLPKEVKDEADTAQAVVGQAQRRGGTLPRNARARLRAANERSATAATQRHDRQDRADPSLEEEDEVEIKKIGAKKAAKLEAKAEKKAMREAEERDREEKKRKKEQQEEERKKLEAKEEEEEKRREEEERKAREEEERRQHEEYLKMKAAFSIEGEGFDENETPEDENLLETFIQYIEDMKIVNLEDLASRFRMKTQAVIDRIQELQNEKRLSGVIDDRGKFIFISQKELEGFAKFIKQRGRVSLSELAESSHTLVTLVPKIPIEST